MSVGSICSSQSHGIQSHSSTGSRRSKGNNYKTVSRISRVDENLFGEPNYLKLRKTTSNVELNVHDTEPTVSYGSDRKVYGNNNNEYKEKEETIRIITKDMVRNLRVPREDPSLKSMVLDSDSFAKLRNRARIVSNEEKLKREELIKTQKDEEMMASQGRRQEMKRHDILRQKNNKMTDLEEEAYQKAQTLLKKAMEQRQEQEDEIKKLNELISNAKIQAIRDAQILEKEIIKKENLEEDHRLDKMMEIDRINAIRMQEEIEIRRKEDELLAASSIIQQIEQNEQERLIDLERKDQENKLERERVAVLMEEELLKRSKIRQNQENLRNDLNKSNEEMLERKVKEKELEQLLDLRVLEIQREKALREAEFEAEAMRVKAEKEREVGRLRALQERAKDEQAERDELRARRAMEEAEREWRRKEIEHEIKKKQVEEDLLQARAEQAEMKEHFLAIQAARDRAEFERTIRAQRELIERDKQREAIENSKRSEYSKEIRNQIRKNEETKIAERNAFFKEGEKIEEEKRLRKMRMEEAKNRKLEELRNAGISEKFLKQIERKIQQVQNS